MYGWNSSGKNDLLIDQLYLQRDLFLCSEFTLEMWFDGQSGSFIQNNIWNNNVAQGM
jgi:hypothetical protein